MRTCGGCGDWVGDTVTACPKCGSPAPPIWAPPVPPGWDAYAEPSARPRRKHGTLRIVLLVLAGVAGAFATLVVALVVVISVFGHDGPVALDGYMRGKGTQFSFARDQTSVRLPERPVLATRDQAVGHSLLRMSSAAVTHSSYEMDFFKYTVPSLAFADAAKIRQALERSADAAAAASEISVQHADDTPLAGYPARAIHGTIKSDDVDLVLVYARGTMYGLFVHTKHGSAEVMKEFRKSFQPR